MPPQEQRRALAVVLRTISPEVLAIPDKLNALIPPHPSGVPRTRESFPTDTIGFDPMGAASSAAQITIDFLLNPQRAARLIEQHERNLQNLGFNEVIDGMIHTTWKSGAEPLRRAAGDVVLAGLIRLATDEHASEGVRAMARLKLHELRTWASQVPDATNNPEQKAHLLNAAMQIRALEDSPVMATKPAAPVEVPPGAPIGMSDSDFDFALPR